MKKFVFIFSAALLLVAACKSGGKKNEGGKYAEVFTKHQSRITELRNTLSAFQTSLKEAGTTATTVGDLNPAINLGSNDPAGNLLILQHHLLAAPENFTSYDSLFGLYYNTLAADAFRWSGNGTKERAIFEKDYLSDADVDKILSPLSADRFPYLLLVKATALEQMVTKEDGSFEGGGATAFFYLIDLHNKKELSSITLSAKPDEEMLIAYRGTGGEMAKNEAAVKKIKETMQKNMRSKVYAWLTEITGGKAVVPAY
jgi:hypothetical protein